MVAPRNKERHKARQLAESLLCVLLAWLVVHKTRAKKPTANE